MDAQQLERFRIRARCALKGHQKTWDRGFLGPVWKCQRCGAGGDLEAHSSLSWGEHLIHLAISVAILAMVWWGLKLIF